MTCDSWPGIMGIRTVAGWHRVGGLHGAKGNCLKKCGYFTRVTGYGYIEWNCWTAKSCDISRNFVDILDDKMVSKCYATIRFYPMMLRNGFDIINSDPSFQDLNSIWCRLNPDSMNWVHYDSVKQTRLFCVETIKA